MSSERLSCVVGGPHFCARSSTVRSLDTIHLPQRKVSSACAHGARTARTANSQDSLRSCMAGMLHPRPRAQRPWSLLDLGASLEQERAQLRAVAALLVF